MAQQPPVLGCVLTSESLANCSSPDFFKWYFFFKKRVCHDFIPCLLVFSLFFSIQANVMLLVELHIKLFPHFFPFFYHLSCFFASQNLIFYNPPHHTLFFSHCILCTFCHAPFFHSSFLRVCLQISTWVTLASPPPPPKLIVTGLFLFTTPMADV